MLAAGSRLGPYAILAPIGAGGMGEVYRARDPRLGREVAVKVLPADIQGDGDRLRRFEQEARAASALNHPNILTVFDTGSQDGTVYLVTELLEGETLRERLAGGALPARKSTEIAIQVARGLAAAHERGIVHRDIKPENLFLTRDGRVKILDFGLARLQPSNLAEAPTILTGTEPGVVLGTVGYMAPEQVRGQPADHRADLFALGAVLYEMLAGRRAFQKDSAAETMTAILREEPPELAVPPGLDRVVRHCLEKEPRHRFQSASDLAFGLESLSAPSGSGVPAPPVLRRRRWGAVLLLAAGVLAGLLVAWPWRESEPPGFQRLTFHRGFVFHARFAPDGQTIVYSAAWDGKPYELFTTRTDSPESRSLDLPNATLQTISPRGEMLIDLLPEKDGARVTVGRTVARVSLAGGAPRPMLEEHHLRWVDWAPDGQTFAVLLADERGFRIEYPHGKVIWRAADYSWDLKMAPNGDALAFCKFGDNLQAVVILDRAGKVVAQSGGWGRPSVPWMQSPRGCVAWAPDGKEVWFAGIRQGRESGLYALDRNGAVRPLLRVPGALLLLDVARDGRALVAQGNERKSLMARAPGETEERDLSWLESSLLSDLSADGRWILFTEVGQGGGERASVYLRSTDGSPAVRLGDGMALALSPDGRWALARSATESRRLFLLPTGAGEPRALPQTPIVVSRACWLPGGKQILINGFELGKGLAIHVMDIGAKAARPLPLMAGGAWLHPPSPDGSRVATWLGNMGVRIYPLGGGEPRAVPGASPLELPIQWRADGRALYLGRQTRGGRFQIDEVDLATGRRAPWKELRTADPAGAWIDYIRMTPNGEAYAYNSWNTLSALYLAEGLR